MQEVKKSSFVIVHYGIFKIGWDWLILLCTVYIAIMVPFNAAFRKFDARKSGRFRDFMYIDAGVEVLFAIGGCGFGASGKGFGTTSGRDFDNGGRGFSTVSGRGFGTTSGRGFDTGGRGLDTSKRGFDPRKGLWY